MLANAVDPAAWPLGHGGPALVWFGRIVPEKAPHLAIEVARRLGRPLVIAGRIGDAEYAERHVLSRVSRQVRYAGQLPPRRLAEIVGRSACSIATPAWEEPFGLVAPEALMCGTPVASFGVGGVSEIARGSVGMVTAPQGDTAGLSALADGLIARSESDPTFRARIRARAELRFSLHARKDALEQRSARSSMTRTTRTRRSAQPDAAAHRLVRASPRPRAPGSAPGHRAASRLTPASARSRAPRSSPRTAPGSRWKPTTPSNRASCPPRNTIPPQVAPSTGPRSSTAGIAVA